MVIRLRLSEAGIKDALRQVEDYKAELNRRVETFVGRLAAVGLNVASVKFQNAEYAGNNDVTCRVEQDGAHATILAEGQAVAFIEFGTGVAYPEHPSGEFAHGTYGKGRGANPNGWAYKGEQGTSGRPIPGKPGVYRTRGNPPAMAMWDASTEMAAKVTEIWREVMRSG